MVAPEPHAVGMGSDARAHHLASGIQSIVPVLALEFGLGAVCPGAMPPEKHGFWEQMQTDLQVMLPALCHMDAAAHPAM